MDKELLKKAIDLYTRVKKMYLFADETSPEFETFLQPALEINRGFDHLARVLAVESGVADPNNNDQYCNNNLTKTIGHFYRAFFDITDWLSVNLRDSLLNEFSDFSRETIAQVIPEYYSEIKPNVEEVSKKIAEIRSKKDIGNNDTTSQMEEYEKILEDLQVKVANLKKKKPGLIEYEKQLRKDNRKAFVKDLLIKIIAGIILLFLGICIGRLH